MFIQVENYVLEGFLKSQMVYLMSKRIPTNKRLISILIKSELFLKKIKNVERFNIMETEKINSTIEVF